MTRHILAIDQGGHASRALLFDPAGRLVDTEAVPVATTRSADGQRVEHDAEALAASVQAAIAAVGTRAAAAGWTIAAAGLATQRSSIACWHRGTGAAIAPVISWQDRRNAAWLRALEPRRDWIRARTGLVLSPHYGASKLRWCLEELPAVRAAAEAGTLAMGPLASFLLARLLAGGPCLADPANASRTQLWDPARRDWDDELLALFGVPRNALPACVDSRHDFGFLETPAGVVPLLVATGDQSAVPFAFGPLDPATAYVNAGTGAFVQRALHGSVPTVPRLLASVVWSDAQGVDYLAEGTVNGAGSALDWLADREGTTVEALLHGLEAGAGGAEPPLFLNGVGGLGSPFWVSDFDSRFVGAGTPATRALAVLESIVFLLRVNLDELRGLGPPFGRIVLTGGLAASATFCRRLADLGGLPVWRSTEAEATARGLARLVAGPAAGWDAGPGDTLRPHPDPALAARFERWRASMPAA